MPASVASSVAQPTGAAVPAGSARSASGRSATVTAPSAGAVPASTATAPIWIREPAPSRPSTVPGSRLDVPMKRATNGVEGWR